MNTPTVSHLVPLLAAVIPPALLVLIGAAPGKWLERVPLRSARLAAVAAAAGCAASMLVLASVIVAGPVVATLPLFGPVSLSLHIDTLAALVLLLVSFLLTIVLAFSRRYMAGEPGHGRFTRWLCLTGASVLLMVVSGNLLQFAVAWSATSLCLHKLLVFYGDRASALLAARKKFLISRVGDVCLGVALLIAWRDLGTWEFQSLFDAAGAGAAGPMPSLHLNVMAVLIAIAAILKSAQVPFHSWLPDTMDAPTPVSALMHAGVINGGGFMVMRLAPVVGSSSAAMNLLIAVGAVTALTAALVMLAQASVKRALAFSTVAQMGFMLLECGLGAFGLALLHLLAHSLYKAHAFLGSGSVVGAAKAGSSCVGDTPWPVSLGAVAVAGGAVFGGAHLLHVPLTGSPGVFVLACAFTAAIATLATRLCGQGRSAGQMAAALAGTVLLAAAYLGLHEAFSLAAPQDLTTEPVSLSVGLGIAAVFLLFVALDARRFSLVLNPRVQALYVHARNGFYLNTLANRLVLTAWPIAKERA